MRFSLDLTRPEIQTRQILHVDDFDNPQNRYVCNEVHGVPADNQFHALWTDRNIFEALIWLYVDT